jgi:hypothetical protein
MPLALATTVSAQSTMAAIAAGLKYDVFLIFISICKYFSFDLGFVG